LGYAPVGYTSSVKALQAFRADPARFDLVLTDQQLPELGGTELVTRLKALRPQLPAILMTGHGGEGLESRIRSAGVDAVLHKPVLAEDMAICIARVLSSTRPREPRAQQ
ncbi:response regulator, partial [Leptospira sp. 96542]|nr:response regulator [Leptospira sp. 96542]